MKSHENSAPSRGKNPAAVFPSQRPEQRVNACVADDVDGFPVDALAKQVRGGHLGGAEMQPGPDADHAAVEFLGKRLLQIEAAQPGFHVRDGYPFVEACNGAQHGARGVPLDDDHGGAQPAQMAGQFARNLGEKLGDVTGLARNAECFVGAQPEMLKHLSGHDGVLSGQPHCRPQLPVCLQGLNHGRQLDDFRPSSCENDNLFFRRAHGRCGKSAPARR